MKDAGQAPAPRPRSVRRAARPLGFLVGAASVVAVLVAAAILRAPAGQRPAEPPAGSAGWNPGPSAQAPASWVSDATSPPADSPVPSTPARAFNVPTAKVKDGGIVFDYPSSWHLTPGAQIAQRSDGGVYVTILGFLGTASFHTSCADPINDDCGAKLGRGQVALEVAAGGSPVGPGVDPDMAEPLDAGQEYVTVDGLPAIFEADAAHAVARVADQELALEWTLAMPVGQTQVTLTAWITGPGEEEMRAEVEALVLSIRYDPPALVLNPADGPRMLAIGLQRLKATEGGAQLDCFPDRQGVSVSAVVTNIEGSGVGDLSRPLPVVCTSSIRPLSVGLWELTFTETWTAASDRSAGSASRIELLTADGFLTETSVGPTPSEIPYWSPDPGSP